MRLDYILRARLADSFRQPLSLIFIILAIIVSLSAAVIAQEKLQTSLQVAIVVEDTGDYGQRLISFLAENNSIDVRQLSREEALKLLNQDRLEAIVIICSDFSDKIQSGQFRNTLELYTMPSSQAPATISEPLINGTMMLWLEQLSLISTEQFLQQQGSSYDAADQQKQREQAASLWGTGSLISVESIELDGDSAATTASNPFSVCLSWYGVLCLFYLVIGASWVLDINQKSLRLRINRAGVQQWQMIIANCLAPLIICISGYLLTATACCLITNTAFINVGIYLLPMLIYLMGSIGMTLLVASVLENILSLMFLAPLLTFLNGVLNELLLEMPDWADVLTFLSRALPGRWLNESISAPFSSLPGAAVCCAIWLGMGIAVSILRTKHSSSRRT